MTSLANARTTRYTSVDVFRLMCAVMVVIIHTHPLSEIGATADFITSQIIPRIGVPFFFASAGFFFIKSLLSGKNTAIQYFLRLLRIYTIWSIIYFAIDAVNLTRSGGSFGELLKECFIRYFIFGSSNHFWYFPAILFSVLVVALVHKMHLLKHFSWFTLILYIVGCLGCSYYKIGNSIPFISTLINHPQFTTIRRVLLMGLPFFTIGYFLNVWGDILFSKKKAVYFLPISVLLWLIEIVIVVTLKLQQNIIITLFLYPMLFIVYMFLLQLNMKISDKIALYSRISAGFMYYSHPIIIMIIGKLWILLFNKSISPTVNFVIVTISALVGGYLIQKLNNKRIIKLVT